MPNKTLEQYQAEIEQLRAAMTLPGVKPDEAAIYSETIQKIEGRIIDMLRAAQVPVTGKQRPEAAAPPQAPATPAIRPAATATDRKEEPPIPVRVIRAGIDKPRHTSQQPAATDTPVLAAILTGSQKQVLIEWGHGKSDLLTEGEARSRFTTALRDLAESRMAKLGRYDDLTRYITFSRAIAYYRALTEFWAAPPTAQQLAIAPMGRLKQEIFEMITQAARLAAQQSSK